MLAKGRDKGEGQEARNWQANGRGQEVPVPGSTRIGHSPALQSADPRMDRRQATDVQDGREPDHADGQRTEGGACPQVDRSTRRTGSGQLQGDQDAGHQEHGPRPADVGGEGAVQPASNAAADRAEAS